MRFNSYLTALVGTALSILCLAILINYVVDPYDVFGHSWLREYGQPQERFLKIEYLSKHKSFDTFLLGSSRIGTTPTEVVAQFCKCNPYNLTVSQTNQWDNLVIAKWLLANQPKIKRLMIQIDWHELSHYGPERPNYYLLTKMHPDVTGESRVAFFKDYLLSFSWEAFKIKVKNNFDQTNKLDYSIEKGYWSRPNLDNLIDTDCPAYVRKESSFSEIVLPQKFISNNRNNFFRNIEAIEQIKKMATNQGVDVIFFLTPHHRNFLDEIDIDDYQIFLEKIVKISPLINFMYYSKETLNSCNYYEAGHHRAVLAKIVVKDIFSEDAMTFGRRVSLANLEQEKKFLLDNFESARFHRKPFR